MRGKDFLDLLRANKGATSIIVTLLVFLTGSADSFDLLNTNIVEWITQNAGNLTVGMILGVLLLLFLQDDTPTPQVPQEQADSNNVVLNYIQVLNEQNQKQAARIDELETQVEVLTRRIGELEQSKDQLCIELEQEKSHKSFFERLYQEQIAQTQMLREQAQAQEKRGNGG